MARVLFAREFGDNLGQLAQLVPPALQLRDRGHQPVFAVTDASRAESALGPHALEYLQAPLWQRRLPRPQAVPCSYSEILHRYGYLDAEGLLGLVKAWREIYRLVDPQVIVFEHAPTALLASRGIEAARVICGVGFCSPPRQNPLPSFRTWEAIPQERLAKSDAQALATVNTVLSRLRLRALDELGELFDADREFLCTFRELDHYQGRESTSYCGTLFARDQGAEPVWPTAGTKRVYVHLRPELPAFQKAAEVLSDSGWSVLWLAPGVGDETVRRYADTALRFVRAPVHLAAVAARADAAVLSGNHATVSAMLLAGRPMALFPTHVEEALVARNAARIGAAAFAAPQASLAEVRSTIAAALDARCLQAQAAAFGMHYKDFEPGQPVARIAHGVEEWCGQAGAAA